MSGFVAIIDESGRALDPALLRRLTELLRDRGPDGDDTWADGAVGLGATHLAVGSPRAYPPRPLIAKFGTTCLAGQVRLDAPAALRDAIGSTGRLDRWEREAVSIATDQELVLLAYRCWGDQFLDYLRGDFAFAIWDGTNGRLLCARDQLGMAPAYYARSGHVTVVASSLECVRGLPGLSDELDELALCDYLLFGVRLDRERSAYAAVHRLPAAHRLDCGVGVPQRYWKLEPPPERRRASGKEAVEEVVTVLSEAIEDRLGAAGATVLMSGGLDSPLVAGLAGEIAARRGGSVSALTVSLEDLFADSEAPYAELAARSLGIPHELLSVAAEGAAEMLSSAQRPEPWLAAHWPELRRALSDRARESPVVLTGHDADVACSRNLGLHFRQLLRHGKMGSFLLDAAHYARNTRSHPPLGLRTRALAGRDRARRDASFPNWLNPDLVARYELKDRWMSLVAEERHPRDAARRALEGPVVAELVELYDPVAVGAPISVRHPFFDLRVVETLLSFPPLPWLVDKRVLRRACREQGLPAGIFLRPKTPVPSSVGAALLRFHQPPQALQRLKRFVRLERVPPTPSDELLRLALVDSWLAGRQ